MAALEVGGCVTRSRRRATASQRGWMMKSCSRGRPYRCSSSTSMDSSFGSWNFFTSKLAPSSFRTFSGFLGVRPTAGTFAATPAGIAEAVLDKDEHHINIFDDKTEGIIVNKITELHVYLKYECVIRGCISKLKSLAVRIRKWLDSVTLAVDDKHREEISEPE